DATATGVQTCALPIFTTVVGDLVRPWLGLNERQWAELAGAVDTIYHSAARVHLLEPYATLRPENLVGAAALLRLAATGRPKRIQIGRASCRERVECSV